MLRQSGSPTKRRSLIVSAAVNRPRPHKPGGKDPETGTPIFCVAAAVFGHSGSSLPFPEQVCGTHKDDEVEEEAEPLKAGGDLLSRFPLLREALAMLGGGRRRHQLAPLLLNRPGSPPSHPVTHPHSSPLRFCHRIPTSYVTEESKKGTRGVSTMQRTSGTSDQEATLLWTPTEVGRDWGKSIQRLFEEETS